MQSQIVSTASTENKTYDRANPYKSRILSRYRLSGPGSTKETWHVVLDLEGSNISWRPGDSIAIYPENDLSVVEGILKSQSWSPDAVVVDEKTKESLSIVSYLCTRANLAKPTKRLIQALAERCPAVFGPMIEHDDACLACIEAHSVDELLGMAPGSFASPQELILCIAPLLPRFYSIASSRAHVGNQVHCTVSYVAYSVQNKSRVGVCSHFLCRLADIGSTPVGVYIQPTKDFILPESTTTPLIMIGPGTGVAPFVAFMQERMQRSEECRNWLFFGERQRAHDFYYEEFWGELVQTGKLRLDTAFSRDASEKEYVQHKMWACRQELWQWLENGARIYVCGDASRMAKDVDHMLQQIVSSQTGMSEESAKAFCNTLRKEKRYLRDVY